MSEFKVGDLVTFKDSFFSHWKLMYIADLGPGHAKGRRYLLVALKADGLWSTSKNGISIRVSDGHELVKR